jgi:hypothetical protein
VEDILRASLKADPDTDTNLLPDERLRQLFHQAIERWEKG